MSDDTYRERKNTTPESRIKAATHAANEMRMWEWPLDVPATENWVPTAQATIERTRAMYRITPTEAEAQTAIDIVRARHVPKGGEGQ